ncbi:MAG: MSMEG_0569 family flavin-dependent oxidoreductase [Candidatus Dormibacteraceae bacterium]
MAESHDVVIVGGGQAGLSLSHELTRDGREHVILERGKLGQSWRTRWDSFCLVLPNWSVRLAGYPYAGPDPDGFMPRDQLVSYLGGYGASFRVPIREGVSVTALEPGEDGGFLLRTSEGEITSREVVLATGGNQRPHRPAPVGELPDSMPVIGAESSRHPDSLPGGGVLIIGSGQTGCQIAEDLLLAGRDVYIACGRAPWQLRRPGGRDIWEWMVGTDFLNMTLADLPSPQMRLAPNPQLTGRDGGHDLNYRTLQAAGATLVGHLLGADEGRAYFASDLAESVAFGDARYADLTEVVRKSAAAKGLPMPELPAPPPFVATAPESLALSAFGSAIVACGYRPDYTSWVHLPEAFDTMGLPIEEDGCSSVVPGLYVMGMPFQRKRTSATLFGVGEDAEALAERMAAARVMTLNQA